MIKKIKSIFSRFPHHPGSQDTNAEPDDEERRRSQKALKFSNLTAHDIMRPRADIIAIEAQDSLETINKVFRKTRLVCLPVYEEKMDNIQGVVFLTDIVDAITQKQTDLKAKDVTKEALFVSPSILVPELIAKMHDTNMRLALVVDEFGGIDGMIRTRDLFECITECLQDHEETTATWVAEAKDGSYEVDARLDLEELQEQLGIQIDMEDSDDDIQTLGGFLTHKIGRIPLRGELVPLTTHFECEICEADTRRIKRVRIRPH